MNDSDRRYVGSSDIPIIMGLSPFCTRAELLDKKAMLTPPKEKSKVLRVGSALEPAIVSLICETRGISDHDYNSQYEFAHPESPAMQAHVDMYLFKEHHIIEIKTTGFDGSPHPALEYGRGGSHNIPESVRHQVNWQVGLATLSHPKEKVTASIALLSGHDGRGLRFFKFKYDSKLFNDQALAAEEFLKELESHLW